MSPSSITGIAQELIGIQTIPGPVKSATKKDGATGVGTADQGRTITAGAHTSIANRTNEAAMAQDPRLICANLLASPRANNLKSGIPISGARTAESASRIASLHKEAATAQDPWPICANPLASFLVNNLKTGAAISGERTAEFASRKSSNLTNPTPGSLTQV